GASVPATGRGGDGGMAMTTPTSRTARTV
ncbi:hypothetical protein AWZ03_013337, partial [Drosophila navojoa]